MSHPFKHFKLITSHRNLVAKNAFHMGIFWHALKHDLSKYTPIEFNISAKYYAGNHSPVFEERIHNGYFSRVCQHHTRRNPHHWEYWTDFFCGRILMKTMPWVYATEYVCDVLSASYTYHPKDFTGKSALDYFNMHKDKYFMTQATKEYVTWCLSKYAESGWKELNKKNTKAKYQEIISTYPDIEFYVTDKATPSLPPLIK